MRKTAPQIQITAPPSLEQQATTASTASTTDPSTRPATSGPSKIGNESTTRQQGSPPAPRTPQEVIVLGKKSANKNEIKPLRDFGHALALRGNQLVVTNGPGAPAEVAIGFTEGGGKVRYLAAGEQPGNRPVIIFTNSKMQADLDKQKPGWRKRGWIIINNPKETQEAANYARIIAKERGTPLPD